MTETAVHRPLDATSAFCPQNARLGDQICGQNLQSRGRMVGKGVMAALVVALAGLLAACAPAPTPPGGSTTTTTEPIDWTICPTPGVGQVRVATVVEGTGLAGFTQPEVVCVVVPSGASGLAALNARAARIGVANNRLDGSGLLCAIGGLPAAPACGGGSGSPQYWSYWLPDGAGGWSYSPVGPGSRAMQEGSVEGWRWSPDGVARQPVHNSVFALLVDPG